MAKQDNDLSDMLNELAQAQQVQEGELNELASITASPPVMRAAVDDKEETVVEAMVEDSGEISATAVAEGEADEGGPVLVNEAVAELYAVQHENDAAAEEDMLAALAQQTGSQETEPVMSDAPSAAEMERELTPRPRTSGRSSTAARSGRQTKPANPANSAQAVFAPVLITFGILTLLPAVWAVLILMGVKTWMHDGQDVAGMAKLMLVCWPVSLGLLAGGVYMVVQVSKEKAKQKKRDEALAAKRLSR